MWQSMSIPVGHMPGSVRTIFHDAAVQVPHWMSKNTYKSLSENGLLQDLLLGSAKSSTSFHVDAPIPVPSTILVLTGVKTVCHILKFINSVCNIN